MKPSTKRFLLKAVSMKVKLHISRSTEMKLMLRRLLMHSGRSKAALELLRMTLTGG